MTDTVGTDLADVKDLNAHAVLYLRTLGLETAEQVVAVLDIVPRELERYLGIETVANIGSAVRSVARMPTQAEVQELRRLPCALGVDLERIPRVMVAQPRVFPPRIGDEQPLSAGCRDHRGVMPPVRDQGDRGTCVAFASVAVLEHWLTVAGAYQPMSAQFMYWNCKAHDGIPTTAGTWCAVAFERLEDDGVCLEPTWPYNPSPQAGNEGQGPPPVGAQREALSYRAPRRSMSPTSVMDIRNALAGDRVVAVSVPVYNSWYHNDIVRDTGDITMPVPGEYPSGGHAMCVIGCVDQPDRPWIGGGRFIVRNSWSERWGRSGMWGPGHGTIPYAYITRHGMEAYTIARA